MESRGCFWQVLLCKSKGHSFYISTCWITVVFSIIFTFRYCLCKWTVKSCSKKQHSPSSLSGNVLPLLSSVMVDLSCQWKSLIWCGVPLISTVWGLITLLTHPLPNWVVHRPFRVLTQTSSPTWYWLLSPLRGDSLLSTPFMCCWYWFHCQKQFYFKRFSFA